ncbi:DUF4124 domain-containing protein [Lysobacter hankyongensis]|uniref:DUF4124 domain-containing protein n=1 Tax=Lysobacter hankyongensis TaxID=1176535 RepID=A0ABP9BKF3_9GAMM
MHVSICRTLLIVCCLIAACGPWSPPARAQDTLMNRCTGPGGSTIYTDQPCDSIGATARLPRGAGAGNVGGARRGGCARSVQELIHDITNAIDTRDVNRLGAVYHWPGHSPESGYRVLDQLQAIVDRPLVDIVPLHGAAPAIVAETAPRAPLAPAADAPPPAEPATAATAAPGAADTPARPTILRRVPVGLRLEQTLGNGSTPSRTVFGLRRHLDCWWITF